MIEAEQLHARILARLDMTRDMEDEELTELIYEVLQEVSQEEYLPLDQKTMLGKELFNAFRKLDLLQEFLEDDDITEIMINGTQNIFIEKAGRISQSDKRFLSADKLEDVIQQIVAGSNRLVNEASPIVDARLADGSRVNVVLPPVALNGPKDMISRLETMVLMGMDLPLPAIERQIASGLDIIVHLGRLRDKSRKVLEVTEVLGYWDGQIHLQTIYRYEEIRKEDENVTENEKKDQENKVHGEWKKVAELFHREKLVAAGYYI